MCGRSSLTKTEKEIEERFRATFYSEDLERYNPLPNYNVAPTQMHPVITGNDPQHIQLYKWGLVPFWSKDSKAGAKMINARMESLVDKPAFKSLLTSKRCIIPMDGFYEWKTQGKEKTPFRIITKDQEIFAVAGLWDSWRSPETGDVLYTFTVITCLPNSLMETIHDRMPAILLPENEKLWIDQNIKPNEAVQLLLPYPSDVMEAYQVTDKVNNVRTNDASLIQPVKPNTKPVQTSLF